MPRQMQSNELDSIVQLLADHGFDGIDPSGEHISVSVDRGEPEDDADDHDVLTDDRASDAIAVAAPPSVACPGTGAN